MSIIKGVLYVVATPIGNLADISQRALEVLAAVDLIAAEDTRHSARLLQHYAIRTRCVACHEYNERDVLIPLLERIKQGESLALISDAGTPLVSDPGFHLVRAARQQGLQVIPIPGPSALLAALSVSGLPTNRFMYEGFLPAKSSARKTVLQGLAEVSATMVFFESPHRILDSIRDMKTVFGDDRLAVIARELTKLYETVHYATLSELEARLMADKMQCRGEFVVMVTGAEADEEEQDQAELERVLSVLLQELPVKKAVKMAQALTGAKRNTLYPLALSLSSSD